MEWGGRDAQQRQAGASEFSSEAAASLQGDATTLTRHNKRQYTCKASKHSQPSPMYVRAARPSARLAHVPHTLPYAAGPTSKSATSQFTQTDKPAAI
jgi:hypothetical protein